MLLADIINDTPTVARLERQDLFSRYVVQIWVKLVEREFLSWKQKMLYGLLFPMADPKQKQKR